jgi:thiamine-triphosphatase
MIEVEKKFLLTEAQKGRLIEGAQFVAEKKIHDVYFDTPDYRLTTKDWWLRSRDGRFEIKIPLHDIHHPEKGTTQYRELETEDEIRRAIGLPQKNDFMSDLKAANYRSVADILTTRTKYKYGEFTIDLDVTDSGYELAEIELMVPQPADMEQAVQKILAFAAERGLGIEARRGKVLEYIRRNNPAHFQALMDAGVIWH